MPKKPTPKETVSKRYLDGLRRKAALYDIAKEELKLQDHALSAHSEAEQRVVRMQCRRLLITSNEHSFIPQKLNPIEKLLGVKTPKHEIGDRLDYVHLLLDAHHQSMLENYCNVAEESVEEQATLDHSVDDLLEMLVYELETDRNVARDQRLDANSARIKTTRALESAIKLNTDLMEVIKHEEKNR